MGKLFIAAIVALSLVGSASAAEDTGSANAIMPGCRAQLQAGLTDDASPADAFGQGMCVGIISGLATSTALSRVTLKSAFFCAPEGSTIQQSMQVIVTYIDKHPERMDEPFVLLAISALQEAWPCK
jgi:Rap1a immunity proteins